MSCDSPLELTQYYTFTFGLASLSTLINDVDIFLLYYMFIDIVLREFKTYFLIHFSFKLSSF